MRIRFFALASALAIFPALSVPAWAQQSGPPPTGQTQQAPATTPSADKLQRRYAHMFGKLNLSSQQQQQIQSYVASYAQAHPEGSPRDRQATKALRDQIMGALTADQQAQFKQQMQALREQRQAHQQQQPGGQNGQAPQGGPPQQGQPPQGQQPPQPPQR
jgi:Spy/CpxP family protein refolding chaperone